MFLYKSVHFIKDVIHLKFEKNLFLLTKKCDIAKVTILNIILNFFKWKSLFLNQLFLTYKLKWVQELVGFFIYIYQ